MTSEMFTNCSNMAYKTISLIIIVIAIILLALENKFGIVLTMVALARLQFLVSVLK